MARTEKTVFISYRRTDIYTALAVYENLKNQGYDVFFDYRSISSGDFEQIIIDNIKARAHFILILTPTALDRCSEPGDWLRREIETAIKEQRNIIPLFFHGFRFGIPSITEKLTGNLKNLSRYNGLNVHEDYFDEAMLRVRTQYLNMPLTTVLHPVSTDVQKVVKALQDAADEALEQIGDVKGLMNQADEESGHPEQNDLHPKVDVHVRNKVKERPGFNFHFAGGVAGGVLLLTLLLWGGVNAFQKQLGINPNVTPTSQMVMTQTFPPPAIDISLPTQVPLSPTPSLGIGSTIPGKDGMTLFYVPAGEFTMGSDTGYDDQRPAHTVFLEAFWIDMTEVTNKMYSLCVDAGECREPIHSSSSTRPSYFDNPEFENYPVVNVDWSMANTYCDWAGRRLPTEAEWEKAARGENALTYPWGNDFDGARLNFCDKNCSLSFDWAEWADKSSDDGFGDTAPVGSFPNGASPYGVLDMAGNVWEWVADWYDVYPGGDPKISSNFGQKYRVLRGGALTDTDITVRSASRLAFEPAYIEDGIGFRCTMSALP